MSQVVLQEIGPGRRPGIVPASDISAESDAEVDIRQHFQRVLTHNSGGFPAGQVEYQYKQTLIY